MKLCRVGNQTNSPDPIAVNSRVFVGNLNTFQCSKAELERMFQRYGRIAGGDIDPYTCALRYEKLTRFMETCLYRGVNRESKARLDANIAGEKHQRNALLDSLRYYLRMVC